MFFGGPTFSIQNVFGGHFVVGQFIKKKIKCALYKGEGCSEKIIQIG